MVTAAFGPAALPGTAGLAALNGALEAAGDRSPLNWPGCGSTQSTGRRGHTSWNSWPDADRAAYFAETSRRLPASRTGRPEDIAAAVALLVGNGFITGHVLVVGGGAHLAR